MKRKTLKFARLRESYGGSAEALRVEGGKAEVRRLKFEG